MVVCLENKYIGSKSQHRDSCYSIIMNKFQALIWLQNITFVYTIWELGHYEILFWHVLDHTAVGYSP